MTHTIEGILNEDYLMRFHDEDVKEMVQLIVNRAAGGDTECINFIFKTLNITELVPTYKLNNRTGKLELTLFPLRDIAKP
jgi:hypothetical protein